MHDIQRVDDDHPLWPALCAHLERVEQTRWAGLDADDRAERWHYLVVADSESGNVIGNISLRVQDLIVPATEWSGGLETPLVGPDGSTLYETYVQTFAVEAPFRRRGIGRALQLAALRQSRELGVWQMRSWSSITAGENYALKIALGFAAHPATYVSRGGLEVCGVYWVMPLQGWGGSGSE